MTPEQRRVYAQSVWSEVKRRRGSDWPDLPSSAEWDFICKLMDREIPLAIPLRALEDMREVKGLLYAKAAITEAIRQWESRHAL